MKTNGVYVVLAFVIGLAFGLSFHFTVRTDPTFEGRYDACLDDLVDEVYHNRLPTATPHVCPPIVACEVCPYYKALPNVTGVLSTLGLVDYEMALLDTKLENYITSTEGEYDWNLVGILALHRSTHNSLLEAADEVIYWFNLGQLTCQSEAFEICANHSTCRDCMSTFVGGATESQQARHCIDQMMIGR